ncbi:hypothetical protein CHS0354_014452 [Potamilus streckersoni]|uniref:C2H2-type domain-containing protein n=1 Tax=Potamilus streckersoni TaxID=2493646 RepID=A0AAE0S9V6_9BIVA|nr:hypothetical protein CHS0354_014452 [Potamilus streckersoni]
MAHLQKQKLKCQTMLVQVKKFQHKYVVGPDGSYLQEIFANTGVSVEVPLLESPSERITLRGEQEKLGLALKMVCSKANGVICAVVNAPEWLYKFIIGKKGENIRRLIQDCPKVRVEFLQGKDKIQVEGPQNEVLHAASALQDNVNELESHMDFVEVEIEQQFHKHIIGKAGANIRKIRNETGVMIFIPKDEDNINIIRIEGDQKGVKRAKQQVMEIASRMEKNTKKEVTIDQRFHRIIIGAKGKTIQGIRGQFNQIQITFPDQGKKSDTVTLRGPKSDVDKCAVYLVKIAKELECQMNFAEIKIKQQFHKHIIGQTNTEIRRIINETGVMIHIPSHDKKNPIIRIEGESKKVERAKQQLMEMASRMEKKKTKCVIIDQRFHRIIFGAKGKTIQGIQGQFNQVQITFPRKGKRSDTVTLRGPKSDVDKCAVYLVKIAKEQLITETGKRRILIGQVSHKSDPRSYGCNVCNKKFSTKRKRKKHKRHHKEVRPWNFLLVKRFPKKTDYQHYVYSGREKDFRRYDCNICDEEHLTKREPWQHLRHQKGKNNISTYQCDICGKRFSTKRKMKKHRRHKDIRPYQCNTCDDGYSTQRELWQHFRVHKDFRCNKCNNFDEEDPVEMQPWQDFPAYKGKENLFFYSILNIFQF